MSSSLKMKVIHYLTELLQARGNGKASAVGYLAEEHVEHAHFVGVAFFENSRAAMVSP